MNNFKPLKTKEYKDCTNAWLDPDGNLYRCGYMAHNQWASEYLQKLFNCDFFEMNEKIEPVVGDYGYPYEYLCNKGWLRLMTWSSSPKIVGNSDKDEPNKEQRDTMYIWCSLNNYQFEKLLNY